MARKKSEGRGLSRGVERRLREIEGCARRGESVKVYAERTGQSVHTLYAATRQARQAGVLPPPRARRTSARTRTARATPRRFVEAVVVNQAPSTAPSGSLVWRLRLPSGAVLESTTPLDASLIDQLVTALGAAS